MSPRALGLALALYAAALFVACLALFFTLRLDPEAAVEGPRLVSSWHGGQRTSRIVGDATPDCGQGCTRAVDVVVDEAPLFTVHPVLTALSLVPGRDGVAARLGDRTAYATPDDLLAWRAAAGRTRFGAANIKLGVGGVDQAIARLAGELGVPGAKLRAEGELLRFVVRRGEGDTRRPYGEPVPPDQVDLPRLKRAITLGALYLARHVRPDGKLNYEVDIVTGQPRIGANFARLSGATFFLAEAAAFTGNPQVRAAAIRAGRALRSASTVKCGAHDCVGEGSIIRLGGSALALNAYAEMVRQGVDPSFREPVLRLSAFLRRMQRPDGEFMHLYDREADAPIDVQKQYYSGEAAMALARAYEVTRDPADLEAAQKALRYLTRERWSFFGSRYFYGNEHWTCQAIEALTEHGIDPQALDFCLGYNDFSRFIQDADGGYNLNPVHVPRISETGSRTEAAAAVLAVAEKADVDAETVAAIDRQVRGSIGYLMGFQLDPGPTHLMADPASVHGGFPGDAVDYTVRIDFVQHACSGMLRYVRILEGRAKAAAQKPGPQKPGPQKNI